VARLFFSNKGGKMKRSLIIFFSVFLAIMAVGCATMNTVNPMSADVDAKVKNLQAPSGKALVYVVRPTFLGKPFGGNITANDEYVGTTQGGIYVYAVLSPGEYKFKVSGQDNESEIVVNIEANKTYYIYQSVYPGLLKGTTKLELVNKEEGKKALQECTLGDKLGKNIAH
jgi:Protein of unknown function (DUF2846)